jgi:protein-disulfide isomerase
MSYSDKGGFMIEQATEQAGMKAEDVDESPPSRLRPWVAPAWFLLGVLVGVVGFAAFATFNNTRPKLDATAMREAARDGTLDAIATLQASGPSTGGPSTGGSQPESQNPSAPTAQKTFAVREANRVGNKNARVTIVEFSDFQ